MPRQTSPQPKSSCITCPVSEGCLVGGAACVPFASAPIPLPHAGKVLYTGGTPAFAVYLVRAGCVKSVTHDADGNEHVRRFHFPGDLVGLDALGSAAYPSSAVAVTAAQVCRISKGQLQNLYRGGGEQIERLLRHTSNELRSALALSGTLSAEQRVAAFLLDMERQLAPAAGEAFELPMTRRDIGSHLRMATETVCRVLARFAGQGWMNGGSELRILQHTPIFKLARSLDVVESEASLAA